MRIGYDYDADVLQYQSGPIGPEFTLLEIWLGGTDLTVFLTDEACSVIEDEAEAAMKAAS